MLNKIKAQSETRDSSGTQGLRETNEEPKGFYKGKTALRAGRLIVQTGAITTAPSKSRDSFCPNQDVLLAAPGRLWAPSSLQREQRQEKPHLG